MQQHYNETTSYKLLRTLINIGFWVGAAIAAVAFIMSFILPLITTEISISYQGVFQSTGDGFALSLPQEVVKSLPYWYTAVFGSIYTAFAFLCLWQLKNIINSMRFESPFTQKNAWMLRIMGISIVALVYIRQFINYLYALNLMDYCVRNGGFSVITPRLELIPSGVFFALCLFVLAEVFKYGSVLQHEHDTTV